MNLKEKIKKQLPPSINDTLVNEIWYEPQNHISSLQIEMIHQVHEVMSDELELEIFETLQTRVAIRTVSDIL